MDQPKSVDNFESIQSSFDLGHPSVSTPRHPLHSTSSLNLRRLRQTAAIRDLVTQHRVSPAQMIQPLFVVEGIAEPQTVPGLTGTRRDTAESLLKTVEQDLEAGVRKFLLFSIPQEKRLKNFNTGFATQQNRQAPTNLWPRLIFIRRCLLVFFNHPRSMRGAITRRRSYR